MLSKQVLITAFFLMVYYLKIFTCDVEMRDGYGHNWLLFVDEKSETHIMNFSHLPVRGMLYGKPEFYLYTRSNQDIPELLRIPSKNDKLNSTYFNKSNDIRVVTHGWMSDRRTSWLQNIKDSLLLYYDVNVIIVDWGYLAKNPIYPWPAFCTRYIGKQISSFLDACTESFGVGRDRMHLIGHSLGAHIVGYAGLFMNRELQRITGLDPARPLFELPLIPVDFRLDKSDATFVDIIHTCGGLYGYKNSYGHADFYPNNGKSVQPGCPGQRELIDSCSHGRATIYFIESIEYKENKGFIANPCGSWESFISGVCTTNKTTMGYLTPTNERGNFYLHTNNASKYAIEEEY